MREVPFELGCERLLIVAQSPRTRTAVADQIVTTLALTATESARPDARPRFTTLLLGPRSTPRRAAALRLDRTTAASRFPRTMTRSQYSDAGRPSQRPGCSPARPEQAPSRGPPQIATNCGGMLKRKGVCPCPERVGPSRGSRARAAEGIASAMTAKANAKRRPVMKPQLTLDLQQGRSFDFDIGDRGERAVHALQDV
jgi:hypothetical protein